MTPPLLFGWSSFQPEGLLVSCSWDYTSRNFSNRLYYVYLLVFGYIVPVTVLIFCYFAIFRFIMRSAKDITRLILTRDGRVHFNKTTLQILEHRKQTEVRTALIILSLALFCLTAWTPYAVVSLIGQFGPTDGDSQVQWLSPLTTSIPAFFAKTTIIFNPLVYGFYQPQFRSSFRKILRLFNIGNRGGTRGRGGRRRANKELTRMRNPPRHSPLANPSAAAASSPSIDRDRGPSNLNNSLNSSQAHQQFLHNHPWLRRGSIRFYFYAVTC